MRVPRIFAVREREKATMKSFGVIAGLMLCCLTVPAASKPRERLTMPLDGTWQIADSVSAEQIPAVFDHTVPVPGLANLASPPFPDVDKFISRELANHPNFQHKNLPAGAKDAPIGISLQQRNYFWYQRTFKAPARRQIAILKVNKAQFGTAVWLNGKKIGEHLGCFSAGYFDLSSAIRWNSENRLDIRIGAHPAALPTSAPSGTDLEKLKWTPGIYDSTSVFFSDNPVVESIQVAPRIASSEILVQTVVKNYGRKASTFELTQQVRPWKENTAAGQAEAQKITLGPGEEKTTTQTIRLQQAHLWTPEDPFLYVVGTRTGGDSLTTRFGMREFRFDTASGHAYLNGKPYFLRGSNITLHRFLEDPKCGSLPWQEQWVRKLLVDIPKRMHWNAFRFCIGPVPDRWLELADEAGLLIQNEFYLWTFGETFHKEWSMPELIKQYGEWMRDNWNHPSVVIWNSNNETVAPYLRDTVIPAVRPLDLSNRPWDNGWTMPPMRPDDPISEHLYIIGSRRFQWTDLEQAPTVKMRRFPKFNNPIIVNEYGELWLNRDGTPTVLTQRLYDRMLGVECDSGRTACRRCILRCGPDRILSRLSPVRRRVALRLSDGQRSRRLHLRSFPRHRETRSGPALPGLRQRSLQTAGGLPQLLAAKAEARLIPNDQSHAGQRLHRGGERQAGPVARNGSRAGDRPDGERLLHARFRASQL